MMIHSLILMNLIGFQIKDFPVDIVGSPLNAMVYLWNEEMTWATDTIASRRPLLALRAGAVPWLIEGLCLMKRREAASATVEKVSQWIQQGMDYSFF